MENTNKTWWEDDFIQLLKDVSTPLETKARWDVINQEAKRLGMEERV